MLRHPGRDQRRRSRRKKGDRGGGAHRKNEGAGQPDGPQNRQRGRSDDPLREPRAPRPGYRPQSRGPTQGERRGPRAQSQGGGAAKERPQSRGPNNPLRPPGAAAPRAQRARSAQKGRDGRRPGPTRRRYNESPMATRTIRFVVPRADPRGRKLGRGNDAARGQRPFGPMPQRTEHAAVSFRSAPVGSIVGRSH